MNEQQEIPDESEAATALQSDLARRIVELIGARGWQPGARLSVPELARTFGVSRSPVSAALGVLALRGVVGPALPPRRGLQVLVDVAAMDIDSIAPDSPVEAIYRRMMRDRARGLLPQDVSEAELMPRYGIPRGILRKILLRFAAEGLARRQAGHGWHFVDSLDNDQALQESYEFRIAMECSALRSPRFAAGKSQLEALRLSHERILGSACPPTSDEWFRVNATFHEDLAAFSRNRFFTEAIRQQNNLRRMHESAAFTELAAGRMEQSCREHLDILTAVEAGDLEWAEALLRQHLRQASEL